MSSPSSLAGSCGLRKPSHKWDSLDAGMSSGPGEVLRYAHEPFFGSKLAGRMCNLPNIAVTPTSSSAVAGRGDSTRALVTEVTGSDVTTGCSFPSFFLMKKGDVYWDLEGRMYPLASCSSRNSHRSPFSF